MPNKIRRADLQADRAVLIDLLRRNLNASAGTERFDWLYLGSPHGKALAWLAVDEKSGRSIGAAAAFPRKMYVEGSPRLGYVLGDFCIEPSFRTLALALQLQRTCLEELNTVSPPLIYDFPSEKMMAIYTRMGIPTAGRYIRWAKPLRADRQIGNILKQPGLTKWLAAPANRLMERLDLRHVFGSEYTITLQVEDCGEEFTRLARSVASLYGSCVERSAAHLNWRFRKHPLTHHEFLVARRGEELVGYAVLAHSEHDARVVDLFSVGDEPVWMSLLVKVFSRLRAQYYVFTLSLPALETNPWVRLLGKLGFQARECAPIIVRTSKELPIKRNSGAPSLFLTDGDRES
jgi:hypothetical protein